VEIRGIEAVAGANAHGETGRARRTGEANLAARSRHHAGPDRARNVDAAMLPTRIRIIAVAV
jgi:hypothetical protein